MTDTSNEFISAWMGSHQIIRAFVKGLIHDHHTAEDILQSTAIAANTHFHSSYDPKRPFTAWAIGIAKREIAMHYRKSKRNRLVFSNDALNLIAEAHVQVANDVPDRIAALGHCMSKLNERGKTIIDLRYKQDLAPREIADKIGATSNSVSTLLSRLRAKLQQCIEQQMSAWESRK